MPGLVTDNSHASRRKNAEDRLDQYFHTRIWPGNMSQPTKSELSCRNQADMKRLTNDDIERVGELLADIRVDWARSPKAYVVLRVINEIGMMDELLSAGFSDWSFPITRLAQIPDFLSFKVRRKMMDTQDVVLSDALVLERGRFGRHVVFKAGKSARDVVLSDALALERGRFGRHVVFKAGKSAPLYEVKERLGSGTYASVEKVESLISHRVLARKEIYRGIDDFPIQGILPKLLSDEIAILKILNHRHMVEFVGSYHYKHRLYILMAPVADSTLAGFLQTTINSTTDQKEEYYSTLRSFFGCLVTGLAYLHNCGIRHKDITPWNILVKGKIVLFSDFGNSQEIESFSKSKSNTARRIGHDGYSAPESWEQLPGGRAADVWSLGCTFLEMIGALCGETFEQRRAFFESQGTGQSWVRNNPSANDEWLKSTSEKLPKQDQVALSWAESMTETEPKLRPKAQTLVDQIVGKEEDSAVQTEYAGRCCWKRIVSRPGNSHQSKRSNDEVGQTSMPLKRKADELQSGSIKRPKSHGSHGHEMWNAVQQRRYYRAKELLIEGASVDHKRNGEMAIHVAARAGSEDMVRALRNAGAKVDEQDDYGATPLSHAAVNSHLKVVEKLVGEYRCNLNIQDKDGAVPIDWAAWKGHAAIVKYLIFQGAKPDKRDIRWGRTPCSWAAECGHWNVLNSLINKCAADADSVSSDCVDLEGRRTPLSYAAGNGHYDVVSGLLKTNKVDLSRRDERNRTAMDHAKEAKRGSTRVAKALDDHMNGCTSEPVE